MILYVAAGALHEALAALRDSKLPATAALFLLACHEIMVNVMPDVCEEKGFFEPTSNEGTARTSKSIGENKSFGIPGINETREDVVAVTEYFGHYQRKLVHLCMDAAPFFD